MEPTAGHQMGVTIDDHGFKSFPSRTARSPWIVQGYSTGKESRRQHVHPLGIESEANVSAATEAGFLWRGQEKGPAGSAHAVLEPVAQVSHFLDGCGQFVRASFAGGQ